MIKPIVLVSCFIWTVAACTTAFSGTLEVKSNVLLMKQGQYALPVSLNCPQFHLDSWKGGGSAAISKPSSDIRSGEVTEWSFAPIAISGSAKLEVKLFLQWSVKETVLRKWTRFRLTGVQSPMLLKEVVLDNIKLNGSETQLSDVQTQIQGPQSYPIFLKGFFAGIEFPISATRIEATSAIIAHAPGWRIEPGKWYQSRTAVYGSAPLGKEKAAFLKYIQQNNPGGGCKRFFVWETWGSIPMAYTEADILEQLKLMDQHLGKPYGVAPDAIVMTAGWSNSKSIWEIDKTRFPDGWTRIQKTVEAMKFRMGMWISPSCAYTPWALDNAWANAQGYHTLSWTGSVRDQYVCLAGDRYYRRFKERLVDLFGRYNIKYAYFDGYCFVCWEKDHGHEPGILSAEPTAEHLIDVFQTLRQKHPDIWLEATCFGGNASPWWLRYVNTVLGNYGMGDNPAGHVPCPVYRESCTTARDAANLQGQHYGLCPISCQDVFGGFLNNQQLQEYVMVDDMVMGVMRGNMLYMMGINHKLMGDYQWAALAGVIKWARQNVSVFAHTEPLLPLSWQNGKCPPIGEYRNIPYGAYGYAHWASDRGLIALRNPWITPQSYTVKLDGQRLSAQAEGLSAVSIYPEPRVYAANLSRTDSLTVTLAPYELVVLDIQKRQSLQGIPKWDEQIGRRIKAAVTKSELKQIDRKDVKKGEDKPQGKKVAAVSVNLQADVSVSSSPAELLILLDGDANSPADPEACRLEINGSKVAMSSQVSAEKSLPGAVATFAGHWRYLKAALKPGNSSVNLSLITKDDCARIGIWVWATKPSVADPRKTIDGPITLPSPESLSLDSATLLELVEVTAIPKEKKLQGH